MVDDKEKICPIMQSKCKENCEWAIVSYDMNDDGITKYVDCSVKIIGQTMLKFDFDFVPLDEED